MSRRPLPTDGGIPRLTAEPAASAPLGGAQAFKGRAAAEPGLRAGRPIRVGGGYHSPERLSTWLRQPLRGATDGASPDAWNGTDAPFPDESCIHDLVAEQALRTPDVVAIIAGPEAVTYRELDDRASRLASYLQARGVGPETLVGVFQDRSVDLVVTLLGVLKAGGAYLPLEPATPIGRVASLVEQARPAVVVTNVELTAEARRLGAELVVVDEERRRWMRSPRLAGVGRDATSLAYVLFTSGSTGEPKGVMVEHRALVNHLTWRAGAFQLRPGDRVLQKAPLGFDVSAWEIFCPLICGSTVVMLAPRAQGDPKRVDEAVRSYGITAISFAPSMLQLLADRGDLEGWGTVRLVAIGGEALSPALAGAVIDQLPQRAEVLNLYGPTEATIIATAWHCRSGDTSVPIGRPIANTRIQVLDAAMQPTDVGTPGELYIGGRGLARGYLNRPDLTRERFVEDPVSPGERLYRTGDRGRWRSDGVLEFLGRTDSQVKIRGNRVELEEVEAVLLRHPAVTRAMVAAVPGPTGAMRLQAYLVYGGAGPSPAHGELRTFLEERLPTYMLPSDVQVVDALPMTSSGKVDRKALSLPTSAPEPGVHPMSPEESEFATRFETLLGVQGVGADSDFFALGGDSLLAARLLSDLERGSRFSPSLAEDFLRTPTPRGLALAATCAQEDQSTPARAASGQPGDAVPAVFFVHVSVGAMQSLRHFVGDLEPEVKVVGLLGGRHRRDFRAARSVEQVASELLEAIRGTGRSGPFSLAGYSLGGLIAYEMAQQLIGSGEEVNWLGVIDGANSHVVAEQALWPRTPRGLLKRLRELGPRRSGRAARNVLIRFARTILVGLQVLTPEAGAFDYRGAYRLAAAYHPAGTSIAMDLFTSDESVVATNSPSLGWDQVHRGPIAIHRVPGSHLEMMTEPAVHAIAAQVRQRMAEVATGTPVAEGPL